MSVWCLVLRTKNSGKLKQRWYCVTNSKRPGECQCSPSWLGKGDWFGLERKTQVFAYILGHCSHTKILKYLAGVGSICNNSSRKRNPEIYLEKRVESRPITVWYSCRRMITKSVNAVVHVLSIQEWNEGVRWTAIKFLQNLGEHWRG